MVMQCISRTSNVEESSLLLLNDTGTPGKECELFKESSYTEVKAQTFLI